MSVLQQRSDKTKLNKKKAAPVNRTETVIETETETFRAADKPAVKPSFDWVLLLATAALIVFGLIMVYSASSYNAQIKMSDSGWYVKKQLIAVAVGAVGLLAAFLIPYDFWKKRISAVLFLGSLVLLMLVLTSIGIESYGARRWIDLKVITLQPSEVVKIGLILFVAAILCKYKESLKNIKAFGILCLPTLAAAGLCAVVTDDLGTAIVMFAIGIVMMLVVSPKPKYVAALIGIIVLLAVIFIVMEPYRRLRIVSWLNPEAYADDESFQVMQGLYAIGSGGLFGKGIGKSTQKMSFVPECENDMIFSILCEELGIAGAILLIALFAILIWRLWVIYKNTYNDFGKLIIAGIMTHIGVQTFLNMGVVTGLLPNTGVPLPFISYGGSSIIMLMIEIGLALSVGAGRVLRVKAVKPAVKTENDVRRSRTPAPASAAAYTKRNTEETRPRIREDKKRGVIYYK